MNSIYEYSNPKIVYKNAKKYLGKDVNIQLSTKPQKKYRRENYLKRTANIRGNWKDNPYSSNMLSRKILWDA